MSATTTPAAGSAAKLPEQVAPPTSFPHSIAEFCTRLSQTDKRVELIAAFHHMETRAGHAVDTFANYDTRFRAFANQPA